MKACLLVLGQAISPVFPHKVKMNRAVMEL